MKDGKWDGRSCPDCSGWVISSNGHIVCDNCGLVLSREYSDPVIAGDPKLEIQDGAGKKYIVDGLGSYIGFHKDRYFQDAQGEALSGRMQKKFKKLKTIYSVRVKIGKNEAKYRALRTLNHVSKLLLLSEQVRDRTAYLYNKIVSESETKVTNNILLIAVCLLMAVREFKDEAPITLDEIADVFEKCGHRVNVRAIVREALRLKSLTGFSPTIRKPDDYVPRVVSMVMNDSKVVGKIQSRGWELKDYETALRDKILEIIKIIPTSKRGGRNPFIFSVTAAYAADRLIALKHGKRTVFTQKLISTATKVAEYSIRDHFGMMKKFIGSSLEEGS